MTAKKREIYIEVEKVRVVSGLRKHLVNCLSCADIAEFINIIDASKIFEINESFIFQLAKAEKVHLKIVSEIEVWVCLKSLLAAKESFY